MDQQETFNPHGKLIEKIRNQYRLTFIRHWNGFADTEYKELIKFDDWLTGAYLWIYIFEGEKGKKAIPHKVELRDKNTAEVLFSREAVCTPLQVFKLVKEIYQGL